MFQLSDITPIHLARFGNAMEKLLVLGQKAQTVLYRNNSTRYQQLNL